MTGSAASRRMGHDKNVDAIPHSRDAFRPSYPENLGPLERQRAQGRPGGRCTRGPRAKNICASALTTGTGGNNRPSLRSGLRLIRALPGEPSRLPPSPRRSSHPRNLAPDLGAPGPHDFAVRKVRRSSVSASTSTAFRSTFVTTRTPLVKVAERDEL